MTSSSRTSANCAYPHDHEGAHDHDACIDALAGDYDPRPFQEEQPMIDYLETRYDGYDEPDYYDD
jgi:hypothetical protein